MRRARNWLATGLTLVAAMPAAALDYRSVVEAAVLYDAPSQQARPIFVVARGTPLEVIVSLDAWIKVRDAKGDLAWIEKRLLSERHGLMVRVDRAQVRVSPEDAAAIAFEAERDVLLDVLEPGPAGWVKVKHRDGPQGYVKTAQVWGM